MTAETATLVAATIAAVAGLLGAGVAIFGVYYQARRLSKLRLAEFRRDWIEALRTKLAEFIACSTQHALHLERLRALHRGHDSKVIVDDMFLTISNRQTELFGLISLLLNPKEKTHEELRSLMIKMLHSEPNEIGDEYERLGYDFFAKAQDVLRSEWKRLKLEM